MKLDDFPDIKRDVSLKGFSTFGVGGPADYFYELRDLDQLPKILKAAGDLPVFILGGGSNVLFPDEGYRGLIVRVMASEVRVDGDRLVAEAGAKWPAILNAMKDGGLQGLGEFMGLPGTIGGAVRGNAGCFGLEIANVLEKAILYDPDSDEIREVSPDYFEFDYRWSRLKQSNEILLEVTLKLENLKISDIDSPEITLSLQKRFEKQPPGKSSGSFFKNPLPDKSAGWLIDQCGLKGFQVGGAQISPKHGNFFMNVDGATAADILALRDRAKTDVKEKFDIDLEEEVVIVQN